MSALLNLLLGAERSLVTRLEEAASYRHPSGTGDKREIAVRDFLRRFIPGEFALAKGRLVDASGALSNEFDIVCYLKDYAPHWLADDGDGRLLVPVEAALFTLEVKSNLSSSAFREALAAFQTIGVLRRHYSETSASKTIKSIIGSTQPDYESPIPALEGRGGISRIVGAIVGLDGVTAQTLATEFAGAHEGFLMSWNLKRRELLLPGRAGPPIHVGDTAVALFAELFVAAIADHVQRGFHVRPNLTRYWDNVMEELIKTKDEQATRRGNA